MIMTLYVNTDENKYEYQKKENIDNLLEYGMNTNNKKSTRLMDETLVDLFYFITVAENTENMSKNSKLATATNKTLKMLFNVNDNKPTLFSG